MPFEEEEAVLVKIRSRLTYANVMATVAVFVALGGTSYAVTTGAIDSRAIKNNTIRSEDIRNNAVRSIDVLNGTLLARDFKAGQLPAGPKGATGAVGSQGPPRGLNGLEIQQSSSGAGSDSAKTAIATCPAGKRVIGTGYDVVGGKTAGTLFPNEEIDVIVDQVVPVFNGLFNLWQVHVQAFEDQPTSASWSVIAYAFCANAS